MHLNWSLVARVAEFTVYYLLPKGRSFAGRRVRGIPRGTHTVVRCLATWGHQDGGVVPCQEDGERGGIGGVFGCVSLFVVEELSGIEGLPRQWLHLNGDQSRQTEETERGGSSGGRQYNV